MSKGCSPEAICRIHTCALIEVHYIATYNAYNKSSVLTPMCFDDRIVNMTVYTYVVYCYAMFEGSILTCWKSQTEIAHKHALEQ